MRTLRKFDVGTANEAGGTLVRQTPAQRRRNSGQRGSTLVEYALTLVISFVLLFAIIDFGRALYSYHFVNYAAREAARYASMRGFNSCGGTVTPCSVTPGDISNFVQQITPSGIDAGLVTLNAPTGRIQTTCQCAIRFPITRGARFRCRCSTRLILFFLTTSTIPFLFRFKRPRSIWSAPRR